MCLFLNQLPFAISISHLQQILSSSFSLKPFSIFPFTVAVRLKAKMSKVLKECNQYDIADKRCPI